MFSIWVSSYWLLLPYLLKSHLLKKEILLLIVISKSLAWRYFMSWTFAWCSSKNAIQIHAHSKSVGTSWNSSKRHWKSTQRLSSSGQTTLFAQVDQGQKADYFVWGNNKKETKTHFIYLTLLPTTQCTLLRWTVWKGHVYQGCSVHFTASAELLLTGFFPVLHPI